MDAGEETVFFRDVASVAHDPVNGPIPMHIPATLIELSGFKQEAMKLGWRIGGEYLGGVEGGEVGK